MNNLAPNVFTCFILKSNLKVSNMLEVTNYIVTKAHKILIKYCFVKSFVYLYGFIVFEDMELQILRGHYIRLVRALLVTYLL